MRLVVRCTDRSRGTLYELNGSPAGDCLLVGPVGKEATVYEGIAKVEEQMRDSSLIVRPTRDWSGMGH